MGSAVEAHGRALERSIHALMEARRCVVRSYNNLDIQNIQEIQYPKYLKSKACANFHKELLAT
jgi:hypothetical protein